MNGNVKRFAVANGPDIFQMLLVKQFAISHSQVYRHITLRSRATELIESPRRVCGTDCVYTGDGADKMSVSLVDGSVEVRVRLGSGSFDADLKPPLNNVRYDDGQWHHLVVSREAREVRSSTVTTQYSWSDFNTSTLGPVGEGFSKQGAVIGKKCWLYGHFIQSLT